MPGETLEDLHAETDRLMKRRSERYTRELEALLACWLVPMTDEPSPAPDAFRPGEVLRPADALHPRQPLPVVEVDGRTVVSLCDHSEIMVRPWLEAGYTAVCVDVQGREPTAGVRRLVGDVRTWKGLRGRPAAVFAFPPCTHLANVGASAWGRKGSAALYEALSTADACLRVAVMCNARAWMIENPVGRLSNHWRPPDHVFSPHEYGGYLLPAGDAYTKRTCLWVGGEFVMPERRPVEPVEGSLVEQVPTEQRRSETPRGFARAVFEALHARLALPAPEPLRSWEPSPAPEPCLFGDTFPTSEPLSSSDPLHPRHALPPADSLRPGEPLTPAAILSCGWCGGEFARGRRDQVYCSTRCRVSAFRSRKNTEGGGLNVR